jgi:hypothetical protein
MNRFAWLKARPDRPPSIDGERFARNAAATAGARAANAVTQCGTGRIPEFIGALMEGEPSEKQGCNTDEIAGGKNSSFARSRVFHVPSLLISWKSTSGSTPGPAKPRAAHALALMDPFHPCRFTAPPPPLGASSDPSEQALFRSEPQRSPAARASRVLPGRASSSSWQTISATATSAVTGRPRSAHPTSTGSPSKARASRRLIRARRSARRPAAC